MNLEEFTQELISDLTAFKVDWQKNNKSNPDIYPDKLNPGDWFEQFLFFLQTKKN